MKKNVLLGIVSIISILMISCSNGLFTTNDQKQHYDDCESIFRTTIMDANNGYNGIRGKFGTIFNIPDEINVTDMFIEADSVGCMKFIYNGIDCEARLSGINSADKKTEKKSSISGNEWIHESFSKVGDIEAQILVFKYPNTNHVGYIMWEDYDKLYSYTIMMSDKADEETLTFLANKIFKKADLTYERYRSICEQKIIFPEELTINVTVENFAEAACLIEHAEVLPTSITFVFTEKNPDLTKLPKITYLYPVKLQYPLLEEGKYEIDLRNCTELEEIPEEAFVNYFGLKRIYFPSNLKKIGSRAFQSSGLKIISFPGSLKTIGSNAFDSCPSLGAVKLPYYIETIEEFAFYNCNCITSIVFPATTKIVKEHAFNNCMRLKKVLFLSDTTQLEENVFDNIENIEIEYQ